MNGGATDERARQRRGSRDIAGEECGDVSMRGIDVFIARAEARHPHPQPDGTAGHARTRIRQPPDALLRGFCEKVFILSLTPMPPPTPAYMNIIKVPSAGMSIPTYSTPVPSIAKYVSSLLTAELVDEP